MNEKFFFSYYPLFVWFLSSPSPARLLQRLASERGRREGEYLRLQVQAGDWWGAIAMVTMVTMVTMTMMDVFIFIYIHIYILFSFSFFFWPPRSNERIFVVGFHTYIYIYTLYIAQYKYQVNSLTLTALGGGLQRSPSRHTCTFYN